MNGWNQLSTTLVLALPVTEMDLVWAFSQKVLFDKGFAPCPGPATGVRVTATIRELNALSGLVSSFPIIAVLPHPYPAPGSQRHSGTSQPAWHPVETEVLVTADYY